MSSQSKHVLKVSQFSSAIYADRDSPTDDSTPLTVLEYLRIHIYLEMCGLLGDKYPIATKDILSTIKSYRRFLE